jgi:hypothetical protein
MDNVVAGRNCAAAALLGGVQTASSAARPRRPEASPAASPSLGGDTAAGVAMAGPKQRVTFGACFLTMTTAAALLLTWTIWWMAVVGTSVPARRPFYRPEDKMPALIEEAAKVKSVDVFEYALHGGWPQGNSVVRLLASLIAVGASFSFAYLAACLADRPTRLIFTVVLALVGFLSFIAVILDAISVASTRSECSDGKCTTAVPKAILLTGSICRCSPDAWFYLTIVVDVLLLVSALSCLVFTVLPLLGRSATRAPSASASNVTGPSTAAAAAY